MSVDPVNAYRREGFVTVREALTRDEVEAARAALAALVRRPDGARSYMIQLEPAASSLSSAAADREARVRKLMGYKDHDPVLQRLCDRHPRLGPLVERLVGEPVVAFQDMALVKPARIGSEKPWHQDAAYFDVLPFERVIGVWIALDDATVENGCMHVAAGGHRDGPRLHHLGPVAVPDGLGGEATASHTDCQIVAERRTGFGEPRAIELPAGGALLFSPLLPHWTPPNASPHRRRALQFHYRGVSTRRVEPAAYARAFVDAVTGQPAACPAAVSAPRGD